jgi:hypothetical protein
MSSGNKTKDANKLAKVKKARTTKNTRKLLCGQAPPSSDDSLMKKHLLSSRDSLVSQYPSRFLPQKRLEIDSLRLTMLRTRRKH